MISILSKECDFETANLYYKKIYYIVYKYCTFKDQTQVYIFFLNQNYICFIEIKKLIKNLFSLNCKWLPTENIFLPDF